MLIACATDRNYLDLTGPFLRSVAANGNVPNTKIVVFADRLTENDKRDLIECAGNLHVRFIDVGKDLHGNFGKIRLSNHLTKSTFARLLLPELLPDVDRALYLDVDTIVNHDLRPLLSLPLKGRPAAAALDPAPEHLIRKFNRSLQRPEEAVYINCGVMLMDLSQWRERNITRKCLDVALRLKVLRFGDQDLINAVLGDEAEVLDRTWNFWSPEPGTLGAEPYAAAHIVHFTPLKPNLVEMNHPARGLYVMHRAQTPWRSKPFMTANRTRSQILFDKISARLGFTARRIRPVPGSELLANS